MENISFNLCITLRNFVILFITIIYWKSATVYVSLIAISLVFKYNFMFA